jgi:hypothetical protein
VDILEEDAPTIFRVDFLLFYPEGIGSTFLIKDDIFIPDYIALNPRRQYTL